MRQFKVHIILYIALLAVTGNLMSQGWEKTFGSTDNESFGDLYVAGSNGFLMVGHHTVPDTGNTDIYLVKTDADGVTQWTKSFGSSLKNEFGRSIFATASGDFLIGGTSEENSLLKGYIAKTNPQGNLIWEVHSEVDSVQGREAIEKANGGYLLIGSVLSQKTDSLGNKYLDSDLFLQKIDTSGMEDGFKVYGGDSWDEGYAIIPAPNNHFLICGFTKSYGAGDFDSYLIKIDGNGNEIWSTTFGNGWAELSTDITATSDGGAIITGFKNELTATTEDIFLLKVDSSGNQEWEKTFAINGLQRGNSVQVMNDGGFIIAGETRKNADLDRDLFLIRTNSSGSLLWSKTYGGYLGENGNAAFPLSNGNGIIAAGFSRSLGAGNADGYLVKTDANGVAFSNIIQGNIFADLELDCGFDGQENGVPNWVVEVKGNNNYFASSDTFGNFEVPVDSGYYLVRLITKNPYWEACNDTLFIQLQGGGYDTAEVEFPLQPLMDCPRMEVDISTPFLRRCNLNQYTVFYANTGTTVAEDASIEIDFDEYLHVINSGMPWTGPNVNTYTFELGDIDVFETGFFTLDVYLDCDSTVTGQTHCVNAHIFPDSTCVPIDPNWDGSSVELSAICSGDSVLFKIKNYGDGNMSSPQSYIIIEDHIMGLQGGFKLDTLQDTLIIYQPNGHTVRLQAEQSPGHPGYSNPAIAVEGCGGDPISLGYVIQFPMNDADPFVDVDCRESIASFDPNDKLAFPKGFGDEHFIEPNKDIEYMIRFQNTGTDTAFLVVIRDTLSEYLDISTLQLGGSSHPYNFEVTGEGLQVLKFTFPNILLPDSTTNEPGSHGFVKFRISQQKDNPIGTHIYNSAAIYFDFNEPIITNETDHLVGENFVIVDVNNDLQNQGNVSIQAYPNPFTDHITFEISEPFQQGTFEVFDMMGRLQHSQLVTSNKFEYRPNGLIKGIYVFQLSLDTGKQISGKIMLR